MPLSPFIASLLKLSIVLFLLVCSIGPLSAQVKLEKEERIKSSALPPSIQKVLNTLPPGKKGKWYKETSLDGVSYEYKVVYNKRKYSIEFSSEGELEDVEILLKKKDISDAVLKIICSGLSIQYQDFRVLKTQIQLRPATEKLPQVVNAPLSPGNSKNAYELIVEIPAKSGKELREILLSSEGEILSSKKIIAGNQDNLEF
jgi:hypothetical protein